MEGFQEELTHIALPLLQTQFQARHMNSLSSYKKNSYKKAPSLILFKDGEIRTSLVVQWLRIQLAIQGTQVQSLVRELMSHVLQSN